MHKVVIKPQHVERVKRRSGRVHTVDALHGPETALLIVDMQLYFVGEGQPSECPVAREIVPNINLLADVTRRAGGTVIWIQTHSGPDSKDDWSVYYERMTSENSEKRVEGMSPGGPGFDIWPELDCRDEDLTIPKTRYSAFIPSPSKLEEELRKRGINTVLVTGVSTCTCCESTARDAMMLNFRTMMISDANAAPDDDLHNATLNQFYLQFGDVQSTNEVVMLLEKNISVAAAE